MTPRATETRVIRYDGHEVFNICAGGKPGALWVTAEDYAALVAERDALEERVRELEDLAIRRGWLGNAPCFICGYNGEGYFQPTTHPCMARLP